MFSIDSDVFVSTPEHEMTNVKAGLLANNGQAGRYYAMTKYGDKFHGFSQILEAVVKEIKGEFVYKVVLVNNRDDMRTLVVTPDQKFFTRCKGYIDAARLGLSDLMIDSMGYCNRLMSRERVSSDDYCFCDVKVESNSNLYVNDILLSCYHESGRSRPDRTRGRDSKPTEVLNISEEVKAATP